MCKVCACALTLLLTVLAGPASCLELKNVRAAYGPLGATRPGNKFLPGDLLYLAFDIHGLKIDDKSGAATYRQTMEVTDSAGKSIFKQTPDPVEVVLPVGAALPSSVHVVMTLDQPPGLYKVKVTVTDQGDKTPKSFDYDFELLKQSFGVVSPILPAVGFASQDFGITFALVGMARDKDKMPDVDITLRMLDENGKPTVTAPSVRKIKEEHIPDAGRDLTKTNVVPMSFVILLYRPGDFTIEVQAKDNITKEQKTLRFPLKVIDPAPYLKATAK